MTLNLLITWISIDKLNFSSFINFFVSLINILKVIAYLHPDILCFFLIKETA